MRKLGAALLILIALPLAASALTQAELEAQIAALLAQVNALQIQIPGQTGVGAVNASGASAACAISRYPLKRGDSGEDVRNLQIFLKSQGLFAAEPTGFFGPLTVAALTQFQLNTGIITQTADGGVFGPRTFQYILGHFCTAPPVTPSPSPTPPPPPVSQCIPPPQPNLSCSGSWLKIYSASGCHTGWSCTQTTSTTTTGTANKPPNISGLTGLTTLRPGENGTWTVTATDPENDSLVYSAVFGDEGASLSQLLNISQQGTAFTSSNAFTHAYQKEGSFTIVVFAKDTSNNSAKATLSLKVAMPVATSTTGRSCLLNGRVTKSGDTIPNSTCPVSAELCEFPLLRCVDGSWVAGNGTGTGTGTACYIDGVGYALNTALNGDGTVYPDGISDFRGQNAMSPGEGCYAGSNKFTCSVPTTAIICRSTGWTGYNLPDHMRGVAVACMSSNGLFLPGNTRILGNTCFNDNVEATNCEKNYICKKDGLWITDSRGSELRRADVTPWVPPETFYPYMPISI